MKLKGTLFSAFLIATCSLVILTAVVMHSNSVEAGPVTESKDFSKAAQPEAAKRGGRGPDLNPIARELDLEPAKKDIPQARSLLSPGTALTTPYQSVHIISLLDAAKLATLNKYLKEKHGKVVTSTDTFFVVEWPGEVSAARR